MIDADDKVRLIHLLADSGLKHIEITSFVSPKWVPQLADAEIVVSKLKRVEGVRYTALTPNLKGFVRALEAGVDEVAVFAAASETFSIKNINCTIDESIDRFRPLLALAGKENIPVRGYVSCVAGCPYEGVIPPANVRHVASRLLELGCCEISLGDTIGIGEPNGIQGMLEIVMKTCRPETLAGHFHNTNGRAIENIKASLEMGLRTFDTAAGGLGGCPYAPGAKGNVDTGTVVSMLHRAGYQTGIDERKLEVAEAFASRMNRGQP